MSTSQSEWFATNFRMLADSIGGAVLGKDHVVRLALTCLLSEGHLLLEDYPGTGKTSLARALARTVAGSHSRIQFTPDLLPSDVTGVSVYEQRTGAFDFRQGPIFANIVLGDEINRASPKTQSALLEVMEEGHVTTDGVTRSVPTPFMVIATQNPIEQAGTYRLPEAQLDRFLMKTSLGYPDHESTVALLAQASVRDRSAEVQPLIAARAVSDMARLADGVHVDPAILAYVSRLAEESRRHTDVRLGLSVRGCLAMVRSAKTWALADGRNYVLPDDVKELAVPVFSHRILLDAEAEFAGTTVEDVIARLLVSVEPPSDRGAHRATAHIPSPAPIPVPPYAPNPHPAAAPAYGATIGSTIGSTVYTGEATVAPGFVLPASDATIAPADTTIAPGFGFPGHDPGPGHR